MKFGVTPGGGGINGWLDACLASLGVRSDALIDDMA